MTNAGGLTKQSKELKFIVLDPQLLEGKEIC